MAIRKHDGLDVRKIEDAVMHISCAQVREAVMCMALCDLIEYLNEY